MKDLLRFKHLILCTTFRFKWAHLTERLAYEKAVHHQKMRTEISQAKREAEYFKANVEKSKRKRRAEKKADKTSTAAPNPVAHRKYEFRQKETDDALGSARKLKKSPGGGKAAGKGRKSADPAEDALCSPTKQAKFETTLASTKGKGRGKRSQQVLQSVFGSKS